MVMVEVITTFGGTEWHVIGVVKELDGGNYSHKNHLIPTLLAPSLT